MGCGSCGGRKASTEYLVRYKDGSPEERVASMTEVRMRQQQHPGGVTYSVVPKLKS